MDEIRIILLRIIKIMQVLIILGSSASFIYLGVLAIYHKKLDEAKKFLPWILLGLIILITSYTIPVIILSFLEVKEVPKFP
ncbi:MAG: hypothetical protein QXG78_02115 [Candidatus Methanomethyliaceae archaeon]